MQLRLSEVQRRYLLYLSARDEIGQGEIVRRILERSLDGQPRVQMEGEHELPEEVRTEGMTLRALLGFITEDGIADLVEQSRGNAPA